MSQFDDDMAVALTATLLPAQGDAIAYTPPGGAAVALTAVCGPIEEVLRDTELGPRLIRTREFTFAADPLGDRGGVADPAIKGRLVDAGGEAWRVDEILVKTPAAVVVRGIAAAVVDSQRANPRKGR